ncbi:MAG: enoyl-CoA hydratase/isomerase [Caulobacteraceae bacterium]|nr:enoyl-CoA hydratase/isomerase [Caulobacteraceae bacterium]
MPAYDAYETLAFERRGRVLGVTLNRPDTRNAVNKVMHRELSTVFDDISRDGGADVIVLTGAGATFCAGGDAGWMQAMIDDPGEFRDCAAEAKRIVFSLLELEKPIICRLNGAAAGLGATIALLCDIVIAVDTARIGDPHVRMGLVAGDGGAVIWPQLVGFTRAKELLMTGDLLTAERAEQLGLINHVVPAEGLDDKVVAMAAKLADGAGLAIRWTKTVANIPLRKLAQEMMDASLGYEALSSATADHQEAVTAFREKRKPVFTGR